MAALNWGIIGPGSIAHDFAPDLELVQPAQKIVAVQGVHSASVDAFVKEFSAEAGYTDLEQFIRHQGLDIVYIATPHPQHYKEALVCLQNNIPVLCEKPLTLNAMQTAQLINVSQQQHCFLMEAIWIRFLPGIRKMISLVKAGAIGKIVAVKASMGFKAPRENNSRYFDPSLGGGSLLDLGIYPVFLAHLLLGKPSAVKALARLSERGIDESCSILLDYGGNAQAMLDSTLLSQYNRPAEITGEKGSIRILHPWFEKSPGIELELHNQDMKVHQTSWKGHGLQFEIEEVIQCLVKGKIESDLFSHAFSAALSETLDEIRKQIHVVYKDYE